MPKKHQQRALLTKPQSSAPQTFKIRANVQEGESVKTSVNDLIRESRRLQIQNEVRIPVPATVASLPPSVRAVLDIPIPPPPIPRNNTRQIGPNRFRRVAGPPPPQSWLNKVQQPSLLPNDERFGNRLYPRTWKIPHLNLPRPNSLQHLMIKFMATNWEWHTKHDGEYLEALPVSVKEMILAYISIYNDGLCPNPLRILFSDNPDLEDKAEVCSLDLTGGIGNWTTMKQLEKDFRTTDVSRVIVDQIDAELWDDSREPIAPHTLHNSSFENLKNLSLALTPGSVASWASLLRLTTRLSTIESLSLAYWPQPTYTPIAASTRAVIKSSSNLSVVYGGTDIYTAFDDNWREAAGILRVLSKNLYCLKWLDLTGCGHWISALCWSSPSESSIIFGPEWNGSWRRIEFVNLGVGWTPLAPKKDVLKSDSVNETWDVEFDRLQYRYQKDLELHQKTCHNAQAVAQKIRSFRKSHGGKWIDFELDEG